MVVMVLIGFSVVVSELSGFMYKMIHDFQLFAKRNIFRTLDNSLVLR